MHIHHQPVNAAAMSLPTHANVAAQRAATVRGRLARAASSVSEESGPFESFVIGDAQTDDEAAQRRRNRDVSPGRRALSAEEEKPPGSILSLHA